MTPDEAQLIAGALKSGPVPQTIATAPLWDGLLKIATGLSTAGIIWLIGSTQTMKTEQEVTSVKLEALTAQVVKLDDFTNAPRFTREDFVREIEPLRKVIADNRAALNERTDFMAEVKIRLDRVEREQQRRYPIFEKLRDKE